MPGIVYPEIDTYLSPLATPRDDLLKEMEDLAAADGIPIVGPLVGAFLYQLTHARGARRIFEMGSAIGYSTIWLARAAGPEAEVFYTDMDEERAERARGFFERAGVADRIQVKVGEALTLFGATGGDFDLIFNDLDKHNYPRVLKKALPRLRRGGLLISDNVLYDGQVARRAAPEDRAMAGGSAPERRAVAAVREYNRRAAATEGCVYSILPLRDGVGVLLKQ